jgi:hypothetical protein
VVSLRRFFPERPFTCSIEAMPTATARAAQLRALTWALAVSALLTLGIVIGSRSLAHFDAALIGYTFASLFAAFGITYRYAMWLQRPPTKMYWRRGWQAFFAPRFLAKNVALLARKAVVEVGANRFIFRRGMLRGAAHWGIMWGCIVAAAITFPLVWGWIHFETVPGEIDVYRTYVFGYAAGDFPIRSFMGFVVFHGLVWASFLVIAGVLLAFRRRMIDHGAAAVQRFAEDILPLVLLLSISVTGLMLTVSYTWMHGYAYSFLAILHAVTVIFTMLFLPFGKFFHIFQRPAQLGVAFYKDFGERGEQARCVRCREPFAAAAMIRDLVVVERELGFRYELASNGGAARHYQETCPRCRRALFGLAQGAAWSKEQGGSDGRASG